MDNKFNKSEAGFINYIMENSDGSEERVGDFIVKHDYGVSAYYDGPGGDVVIPELGEYCSLHFNNGAPIRSITFPGSHKRVSHFEFGIQWNNNKHIEELVFEEGIEEIESIFQDCKKLKNVVLPKSLKYLGNNAFKGSPWHKQACEEDGKCIYIGDFLISSDKDIEEAIIKPGTKMICKSAFAYRYHLKRVDIPDSVKTIGAMAFCDCFDLAEVTVPKSVHTIEALAFTGCVKLKKIEVLNQNADIELNLFGSDKSDVYVIPEYSYIPNLKLDKAKPIQREGFAIGFLTSLDRHSEEEKAKYIPYIKRQGGKLTEKIIELGNIRALKSIAPLLFNKCNIDEVIDLAKKRGSTELTAFIMDWKNKNVKPIDVEKQLEKELKKDPYNAADMKKLWISSKTLEGTLKITKYRGSGTQTIDVPPRIGKTPVTLLSKKKYDFDNVFPLDAISITLPEGLIGIEGSIFRDYRGYNDLRPISIPESVKYISADAFNENCRPSDLEERFEKIGETYYRIKGLRKENGMIIVDDMICGADAIDPYNKVWIIPEGIFVRSMTEEFPYLYYAENESNEGRTGFKEEINKGSIIKFGRFPQNWDGKLSPIQWEVLDVDDTKILAISRDILAPVRMAVSDDTVSWEETELRNWLNSIFYEYAFTEEEKEYIIPKVISNDLEDRVSLLNREEFSQYYGYGGKESMKSANSYSTARGFSVRNKSNAGSWWLKSNSSWVNKRYVEVDAEGRTRDKGTEAYMESGVCPVICLKRIYKDLAD